MNTKHKNIESLVTRVYEEVRNIIKEAYEKRSTEFKSEAINWGDLKITKIQIGSCYRPNIGKPAGKFIAVVIEEAAPDCFKLHDFIAERLRKIVPQDFEIRIITEW